MIKHIKKCTFGLLDLWYSILRDLCSFRNKITVFVCVFCVLCIYLKRDDTTVILACLAFLDSYLVYYLYNRKKNDPRPQNGEGNDK